MAFIQWQPEYSVGIQIIDQQHAMLIRIINDIHHAFTTNQDRRILAEAISKLGVYAAMHFAREEHFFEFYGYPDSDDHLQEHDYFEDMISQYEEQFNSGNQDLSLNVLNFLRDWLVNHIEGSDQEYAPYLRARGVV